MNFNGQENAGYGFGIPGAPTPPGAGGGDATGVMMMNGNNGNQNSQQPPPQLHPMQVNPASFPQNSTQRQPQQYLQPQQQQWMNQSFFPYSGTVMNSNQQQQPLQPFLDAPTSVSRATLGLSNVIQQLNRTFQFAADRIQLLNASPQNNSNNNNNETTDVDVCRQGFQVVMQQLQQTQQLVQCVLQTIQRQQHLQQQLNQRQRQQQEQEDDGEPIQFPPPLDQQVDMMQRQEEQQNQQQQQFLSEETQRAHLPANDNGGNSPDSFAETTPANDTRVLDQQQQRRPTLPTNDNAIFDQERLPQPQNHNMNTVGNATKQKPQTQPKRSIKNSTAAAAAAPHRNEYKRRAERPLPEVPPPKDNAKQYTRQQAMEILVETDAKDRNRLVTDWIARKLVPVTAHTTMNKYMREFRENNGVVTQEWERVDDVDENGISKRLKVPEPANGVEYTRREAVRILLDISKEKGKVRDRNMVVTSWIAQGKIPLKSLTAVDRSIQQAEKEGMDSLQEHWGRWGDTQYQKKKKKDETLAARRDKMKRASNSTSIEEDDASNTTKRKKKKATTPTPTAVVLPPYPAPIYGSEYTKLEAVGILQKIHNARERNNVIWKWIHEKQIPISHPNSMARILREARNNTLRNLDWKDGATVKSNLPWTPSPRNGSTYTKAEMIDILSKMNATDRNKLVRLWVHDKKIPYTSALAANNAVIKAIREQQQTSDALGNGDNRINTSAIAATGPSRKKRKLSEADSETAPVGKVGESMETALV